MRVHNAYALSLHPLNRIYDRAESLIHGTQLPTTIPTRPGQALQRYRHHPPLTYAQHPPLYMYKRQLQRIKFPTPPEAGEA